MNAQILQNLKNKLETRYQNVRSSDHHSLVNNLKKFWEILQTKKVFLSIFKELENADKVDSGKLIENIIFNPNNSCAYQRPNFANEKQEKEVAYIVISSLIRDKVPIYFLQTIYGNDKYDENTKKFNEDFVSPIYNHIMEKLDDNVVSLGIFQKYKEKCEWFLGEYLQEKIAKHKENYDKKNPDKKNKSYRTEEQVLAPHLYEYLHDQGLEIIGKEGQLGNGEYDFRGVDFIGEVKIFGDKAAVIQGFVELLRHLVDANLSLGYLVIFNNAKKFLKTPESFQIQDKIIFVITVDIREDRKTPCKDEVNLVEITEDEILEKWNLEKKLE